MSMSPPGFPASVSTSTSHQSSPLPHSSPEFASASLRPILPRLHNFATPSFLGVVSSQKNGKRSRTNVTIACDGCKHARAKCDGKLPCLRCSRRLVRCKYERGQDRRQHRGSQEEIQTLTARLVRYQHFVNLLRNSLREDAHYFLDRLRSASTGGTEDHKTPATIDLALTTAMRYLMEAEQEFSTATNLEDTSALVEWIRHDLDMLAQQRASTPSNKELSPDREDEYQMRGPRTDKAELSVQALLC